MKTLRLPPDIPPTSPLEAYPAKDLPAFRLVRASDMEFKEPEFLIEGVLESNSLALAFGDPGCGKSFVSVDVAACVATGRPFHGREVKQGPVIYIAGEGHNGWKRRLAAWECHATTQIGNAPLFFSKMAARFLDVASAQSVAFAVDKIAESEGAPCLIIIDTLARNFGAGDENQTRDMGMFISALDDLRSRYPGCTVLIVHHTGHAEKQRARGNMALKGALDAEFRVQRVDETVTVTNSKMKDALPPPPMCFNLESIQVGIAKNGTPITSAALTETAAPVVTHKRTLTPSQRIGLSSFEKAKRKAGLGDDLSASIHVEDWRVEFYKEHTADNINAKKVAFRRSREGLVERGDLSVCDDNYRLARLPEVSQ